jgi:hypothetical protein
LLLLLLLLMLLLLSLSLPTTAAAAAAAAAIASNIIMGTRIIFLHSHIVNVHYLMDMAAVAAAGVTVVVFLVTSSIICLPVALTSPSSS